MQGSKITPPPLPQVGCVGRKKPSRPRANMNIKDDSLTNVSSRHYFCAPLL